MSNPAPDRTEPGSGAARARDRARGPVRWVIAVCAAFMIGLAAIAGLAVFASYSKTLNDESDQLARLGLAIAANTHRIVFGADLTLSAVEDRIRSAGVRTPIAFENFAGSRTMHDQLREIVVASSDLDAIAISNDRGVLINTSLAYPPHSIDISDREHFILLRDNPNLSYAISLPQTNRVTGQQTVFLAHRVSDTDGTFLGTVNGTIALNRFERFFASVLPDRQAAVSLYRRDGALLARQPADAASATPDPQLARFIDETVASSDRGLLRGAGRGRAREIVALHTVRGYPLAVTVSTPEAVALSAWRQLALLILAVTAGAVALLALGGYLLARQLSLRMQVEQARAEHERAATAERVQAAARDELKEIMDHAGDGLILVDEVGIVLAFSRPAEAIFGYKEVELVGREIGLLVADPSQHGATWPCDAIARGDAPEAANRHELDGRRKTGEVFPMEVAVGEIARAAGVRRFVVTVRDISESKLAQEQLRQSQKMDAIGQLTGGVAHDFNNILTVVTGTVEMLADGVADRPKLAGMVQMIDDAAARGADLTRQLLAFSRKQPLEPRQVDINALISEASGLLRPTLGEHIEIETMLEPDAWRALIDPSQLSTALLNLAINARDAMRDGGKLTFESGNVVLDEAYARTNPEVEPGPYVMIAVSDSGAGIPAAIRERIFEPFFTTKELGRGTGLGLSMVYGFVKQSRGHLKVYSEEGHGTTVRMYLPRSGDEAAAAAPASDPAATPGGDETVLAVEDDEMVRNYVLTQLTSLGYTTLSAGNAAEALELIDGGAQFDVLFTDVIMTGGMNGRQLADEVLKRRPGTKVLYTSGYTENAIVHHGRLDPGVTLLAKPYRKSDLARKIREVLAGS